MLSKASKYAIRALVYMSILPDNPLINIHQLAEKLDVPEQFLGKILQMLAKKKLLYSQKGINGGFKFLKPPSEISFFDIVEIIDGTEAFNDCLLGIKICKENDEYKKYCYFHQRIDPLLENLKNILQTTTIATYSKDIDKYKDILF